MSRGLVDFFFTLLKGRRRTRQDLLAYQSRQLKRLVSHAHRNVPYYRERFREAHLDPDRFQGLEELHHIPVSIRRDLATQPPSSLIAKGLDPDELLRHRTSGSTGEPLTVWNSKTEDFLQGVFRLRAFRHFGSKLPERMLRVRQAGLSSQLPVKRLLELAGLYQVLELSSWSDAREAVQAIRRLKPHCVVSYPRIAERMAEVLCREGREGIRLRWLCVGGSMVFPAARARIEEGFGLRPMETYATRETALLAWECRTTGLLHVNDDAVVLEVLDKGRPVAEGEEGEVVVTTLHSFVQPFIRYRLYDRATRGPTPCPCGLPFATLKRIEGRLNDTIALPEGGLVTSGRFMKLFEERLLWVRQFQVEQLSLGEVVVRIALLDSPSEPALLELRKELGNILGPATAVRIEVVDDIPPDATGKYRMCLSPATPQRQDA